jgi:hypothetical protein
MYKNKSNWSQDEKDRRKLHAKVSAVDAWFISAPPMKASKKSMMKHAIKVLF